MINFGGVRIGGLSGIYKEPHYRMASAARRVWGCGTPACAAATRCSRARAQGHFERPPYNASSLRSAYHIRELDVHRLLRVRQPLDIFLSHDWPQGIARHGNLGRLLQRKGFLRREVGSGPGFFF